MPGVKRKINFLQSCLTENINNSPRQVLCPEEVGPHKIKPTICLWVCRGLFVSFFVLKYLVCYGFVCLFCFCFERGHENWCIRRWGGSGKHWGRENHDQYIWKLFLNFLKTIFRWKRHAIILQNILIIGLYLDKSIHIYKIVEQIVMLSQFSALSI